MIHDKHLLGFLKGLAVSCDPVERFRLAVGQPDPWQRDLLRSDPAINDEDRMRSARDLCVSICSNA